MAYLVRKLKSLIMDEEYYLQVKNNQSFQPNKGSMTADGWAGSWYTLCLAIRIVVAVISGSLLPRLRA